jgi:hypothetical protein
MGDAADENAEAPSDLDGTLPNPGRGPNPFTE